MGSSEISPVNFQYNIQVFRKLRLDYGDILYDKPHNEAFCNRTEKVQYDAALAITGEIRGTSRNNPYTELGLKSLTSLTTNGLGNWLAFTHLVYRIT